MINVFEVVFEGVLKARVINLLRSLVICAKGIINAQCSEDIDLMHHNKLNDKALNSVLNFEGDVSVLINLHDLKADGLILPKVLLRLVKYGDQYDLDFNFNPDELDNVSITFLVTSLHRYVNKIAAMHNVACFFGGLEPASDERTRYFTNEKKGPLAEW